MSDPAQKTFYAVRKIWPWSSLSAGGFDLRGPKGSVGVLVMFESMDDCLAEFPGMTDGDVIRFSQDHPSQETGRE